jgi:uncharacterized membrane protein
MSTRLGTRIVVIALVGALYILVCHWLMTRAHESPWNVVAVLAPMLAAIAIGAWRGGQRWLGGFAALLVLALCGQALFGVHVAPQLLYVAQHVGVNLFLAVGFGSTLRAGHTSLITTMAKRVHRVFTPAMAVYTRKVTLAWTLYFIGMAAVSICLYLFANFDTWALFANILSPITVVGMFASEYLLRYRLHPEFERTTVADAIRSYMHSTAK